MKSWGIGLISIGFVIVMVAPSLVENYYFLIIEGLIVSLIGFIMFKKGKK